MSTSVPQAELVELAVDRYKNLERVRVGWGARQVFYGTNGVGKSNLFEALALVGGTRATLWGLAGRAVPPEAGAISVVVRTGPWALPLGPDWCPTVPVDDAHSLAADARFWETLDVAEGDTFAEAVSLTVHGGPIADLVAQQMERPLVRYRLESVAGLTEAARCDRGAAIQGNDDEPELIEFQRRFSRTLLLPDLPPWLPDLAPSLPAAFAPLRRWLDDDESTRSPMPDLLELPPDDDLPLAVVWLPRERTSAEAWFDLWEATQRGLDVAIDACEQLDRMPFAITTSDENRESNTRWWLVHCAIGAASGFLSAVMPTIDVEPEDESVGGLTITPASLEYTASGDWQLQQRFSLDRFSSGERGWVDQSLLAATVALEDLTIRNTWRAAALSSLSDEAVLDLVAKVEPGLWVDEDISGWYPDDIDLALAHLDQVVPSPERLFQVDGEFELSIRLRMLRSMAWAFPRSLAVPPAVVRLYDEPERHLHPDAQRRVSRALASEATLDQVGIASHSHLFLGRPGWEHFHLSPTAEGVVLTEFNPAELNLTHAITRQMGLSRGELLSRFGFVLFVEGKADEAFLTGRYAEVLDESGILILPIAGIDEVKSLAELKLIGRLIDVGAGVLSDHTRTPRITGKRPADATKEEDALRDLGRMLRRRSLDLHMFGLQRLDIIAYLDEDVIRRESAEFPGWAAVARRASANRSIGFKQHAADAMGVPAIPVSMVRRISETMADEEITPPGDLAAVVADIIGCAMSWQRSN